MNGVLRWSPRFPTLKHAQLSKDYKEQPRTVGELKARIWLAIFYVFSMLWE